MPASAAVETTHAGLKSKAGFIPLEGVSVDAAVTDVAARVVITQRYRNRETTPIEAVYVFPLDDMAAVCGFEAIVDGRHFAGVVQPRDQAFKTYDEALAAGHGSYLLDEEVPDVFTASVGNIPPGAEVLLRITYVAELTLEGDALRFTLPTTVSPRYAPAHDKTGVGRPPSEALNPPVMWQVPYGLDFTMRADMPGAIRRIESPSHPISMTLNGAQATVRLSQSATALDRDVVVLVEAEGVHTPHLRIERDDRGRIAAALVTRPSFDTTRAAAEVIFIVDRSGSMDGSSIAEVRNALQLCLRSLTEGCYFNILGFGSSFTSLFDKSRPYAEASLAEAAAHVASLEADLGGTEIAPALAHALGLPRIPGLVRQLVVLTDGDVTNPDEVHALVAREAANTRVFAFGIGAGASAHLVRGLARAGGGTAEFILPGTRIEAAVVRQLGRVLTPAVSDLQVDWGGLDVTPATEHTPAVFAGSRLVSYAFIKALRPTTVHVTGRSGTQPFEVSAAAGETTAAGTLVATLAARARIREIEDQPGVVVRRLGSRRVDRVVDRLRDEVIELATTYSLVSRETSFVVVEHRENATPAEMELRKVPVALRAGWGAIREATLGIPMHASLDDDGDDGAAGDDIAPMLGAPPQSTPRASRRSPVRLMDLTAGPASAIKRNWLIQKLTRMPGTAAPATASSTGDASPAQRPLDRVVACQRADGSWDLTTALAAGLGIDLDVLEARMPSSKGMKTPRRVWATLLAIAWLQLRASANQDEWQLLAAKADAWLSSQGDAATIAAAQAAAKQVLVS